MFLRWPWGDFRVILGWLKDDFRKTLGSSLWCHWDEHDWHRKILTHLITDLKRVRGLSGSRFVRVYRIALKAIDGIMIGFQLRFCVKKEAVYITRFFLLENILVRSRLIWNLSILCALNDLTPQRNFIPFNFFQFPIYADSVQYNKHYYYELLHNAGVIGNRSLLLLLLLLLFFKQSKNFFIIFLLNMSLVKRWIV